MRDPELVARAGYAAARLEQAWERWRALHGLGGSADPLASYVGYSLKEPMGQPRVVIGVDAAEAEFFADFLESHVDAAPGTDSGPVADLAPASGQHLTPGEPRPASGLHPAANGAAHPPVSGPMLPPVSGPQRVMANGAPWPTGPTFTPVPSGADPQAFSGSGGALGVHNAGPGPAPAPRDMPSEPMVRLVDGPDPGSMPGRPGPMHGGPGPMPGGAGPMPGGSGLMPGRPGPLSAPVGTEHPFAAPPAVPVTSVFPAIQADYPGPAEPPPAAPESQDAMAAELAGWASGELPGQASEQLASWVAGDTGGRRFGRSRSAR